MAANATIRVTFGAGSEEAGAHLSAEIDTRPAGLNGGKSSFFPADDVYFLLYKSSNVEVDSIDCSAGSVALHAGAVTVTKTEDFNFEDTDSITLDVPADAITSHKFIGRDLGALTLQADKMTVKAATKGLAVCRITYTATAAAYVLRSPATVSGETDFTILVLVVGKVVA